MQSALNKLQAFSYPHLELATDFSEIFLTDNKTGAPPYASVYLTKSGQLYGETHLKMQDEFKKQGLAIDPQFNEPADHIAVQLDYLGNLIIANGHGVSEQQMLFVKEHLAPWLNLFVNATDKVTNTGFYQALCHLLEVVIIEDFNLSE